MGLFSTSVASGDQAGIRALKDRLEGHGTITDENRGTIYKHSQHIKAVAYATEDLLNFEHTTLQAQAAGRFGSAPDSTAAKRIDDIAKTQPGLKEVITKVEDKVKTTRPQRSLKDRVVGIATSPFTYAGLGAAAYHYAQQALPVILNGAYDLGRQACETALLCSVSAATNGTVTV